MSRLAALLAASALTVAFAACRGGDDARPTSAPTAAASPDASGGRDPAADFRELLAALNRRDAAGVYAGLSSEARAKVSADAARALVARLYASYPRFTIELQSEDSREVNGAEAQLGLTLVLTLDAQRVPLTQTAFMAFEDGRWKLSDSFLQTALAAGGITQPPGEPRVYGPDGCVEGDVLAGVYLPSRLQVLARCMTVEGSVVYVDSASQGENDGDYSFDLDVGASRADLLNDANRRNTNGGLHIEIVPQDQAALPKPQAGQRVRVQGPWVLDTLHGWNEIHPAWAVTVLP